MNAMLNAKAPNKLARIQHILAETEHRIDEVVGMVYEASNETEWESLWRYIQSLKQMLQSNIDKDARIEALEGALMLLDDS